MNKNKINRFTGIDLCRGLAAFAVILVHSGDETWGIPIGERAIEFRYSFYFAVPFFLATAFYFAVKKLPLKLSISFWKKKFKRLILPYTVWTILYLVVKSIIFLLSGDRSQAKELFSDPIAIVFFGAASYHLYFIPLLFVGLLWLNLANSSIAKQNFQGIWIFCSLISISLYQLIIATDNAFDLSSGIAFSSLLSQIPSNNFFYPFARIALVAIAWLIKCLPYFFMTLLVNKFLERKNHNWLYEKSVAAILFIFFVFTNTIAKDFLPEAISEIAIAYSFLLFGISISRHLKNNIVIQSLGLCSFGIYLIHPIVNSALEIIFMRVIPDFFQSISITSMLIYTLYSFTISWLIIFLIIKNKNLSQYL